MCALCVEGGGSVAKRFLQHEVEKARADRERLASAHEIDDQLCELVERNCTIVELHREKQQLVEQSKALEEEVAGLTAELTKVSVRPAAGEVSRQEIDDLPELESLTTGYLSDVSEAVAPLVQSDT